MTCDLLAVRQRLNGLPREMSPAYSPMNVSSIGHLGVNCSWLGEFELPDMLTDPRFVGCNRCDSYLQTRTALLSEPFSEHSWLFVILSSSVYKRRHK